VLKFSFEWKLLRKYPWFDFQPPLYLLNFSKYNRFPTREKKHVHLFTWVPCYSPQLFNQWKKMIFCENHQVPFQWKYWMTLHAPWSELKFNWLELNSNSFEKKWDTKWWKRYWKFTCEYGVKKQIWKDTFSCLLFENGLNKFRTRIWWGWILWDLIIILPKPIPMNQRH
jgi:hypothetical protein